MNYLKQAAELMPERGRINYNLGLLQQYLQQLIEAEASLKKALEIEPDNLDFLYALTDFYLKRGELGKALQYAQEIKEKYPQNDLGQNLINQISSMQK